MTAGPNSGSRWTPRMVSTPPATMGATSTPSGRAPAAAARASSAS